MKCKNEDHLEYFHVNSGGTLCGKCGKTAQALHLDPSTLYTLQYIITAKIEKLYTFAVSEEVLVNLEQILDSYMRYYIDQKFHALEVLEENQGFALKFGL